MNAASLLEKLFPSPAECRKRALELDAAHPQKTPEELALVATKLARRRAAAVGALSGLAATPFVMVPAASADVFVVLKTEAMLAGVIAAIVAPDGLNDEETFKTDILAILFPAAISNALQTLGVRAGRQTSKVLVRKYVSKNVLKAIVRFAAKYLGLKLTQRVILTKVVPLVGSAIGGTWNWTEVRRLGRRAIEYHLGGEIEPESDSAYSSSDT